MRVFALLDGGVNYSTGNPEPFATLADVPAEYRRRKSDPYFPCWGELREPWPGLGETVRVGLVWLDDPGPDGDTYPSATLELGPRGGIKVVPAW